MERSSTEEADTMQLNCEWAADRGKAVEGSDVDTSDWDLDTKQSTTYAGIRFIPIISTIPRAIT